MPLDLVFVALTLGVASSVHCLAMCGGISVALANAAPRAVRTKPWRLGVHLAAIHGGRIASYGAAGAVAGLLGAGAVAAIAQPDALVVLRYLAAAFLIAIGFTIAGWLPLTDRLGVWAMPFWARLQPAIRRLVPGGPGSVLYGLVWGWLPCGMVYTTLFYAVFAASAWGGAVVMLAFGLGTVPALLALGLAGGHLRMAPAQAFWVRQVLGGGTVALALMSVWLGGPDGPFCAPSLAP